MNKGIFRLVFNQRQGMLVPVAETSSAQGKSSGGESGRPGRPRLKLIAVLIATALGVSPAWANPSNPTVVHGSASFNQAGNTLTVTNTPNAIINWNSFSIGQNEITRFVQQSNASAVLNRVTGQDPSQILGQLQSNGRVFLINPNGVLFGQGARIDVAGLVASSLDIGNEDFIAGRYKFIGKGNEGAVKNAGEITTSSGGQVVLIAPDVENSGIIVSPEGEVILAAGRSVELADSVNLALRVVISAAAGKAVNLGKIMAAGGKVGMYAGAVQQSGLISASSAEAKGGRIFLKGSQSTRLDAGSVTEADGATGGGTVHILSDGRTEVHGNIAANGGGGFIETSAPEIDLAGATVRADQGGKWLIDPTDIAIEAYCSISPYNCVSAYGISSTLSSGTSVVIATNGDGTEPGNISVNGAIDGYGHGSTLTLDAHGGININANIAVDNLSLLAGAGNIEQIYDSSEASIRAKFLTFDSHGHVGLGNRWNQVQWVAGRAGADIAFATSGNLSIVNQTLTETGPLAVAVLPSAPSGLSAGGSITVEAGQNLYAVADVIAGHAIQLTAGADGVNGDLIQSAGTIKTIDPTNPGDIDLHALGNMVLTSVSSMRDINAFAGGNITLSVGSILLGGAGAMNFKDIDDNYFEYGLPFTFTYYGEEYDKVYISSNGVVTFGNGTSEYTNSTDGLKAGVSGIKTVAPAWDDWVTYICQDGSSACGQPTGWDVYVLPGTDSLTIRWNVGHYSNESVHAIFETVLYKDGGIQYNYGPANLVSPSPNPLYPDLAQPTPSIGLAFGDNSHYTLSSLNPGDNVVLDMNYLNSVKYAYNASTGNYTETVLNTSGLSNVAENTDIGLHGRNISLNAGGSVLSNSGLQDITATGKVTINANDGIGTELTPLKIQAPLLRATNGANGVVNLINNGDIVVEGIRSGSAGKVSLDASGTILLRGGNDEGIIDAIDTQGDAALRAGADIVIGDPATPALSANIKAANLEMTAGGRIIKNANSSIAADLTMNGGTLGGSGTIDGDVVLGGDAKLAPGSSPGSLTITGDLTLGAGTSTDIELWGATPGTGFDTVSVGGTVNLGGTLNASLGNGYAPGSEVSHDFLSAGAIVGDFASKNLPMGFTWTGSPTKMALVSGTAVAPPIDTPQVMRAIGMVDHSLELGLDTPLFDTGLPIGPGPVGPGSPPGPGSDTDLLFDRLIHEASVQELTDENSLVCR